MPKPLRMSKHIFFATFLLLLSVCAFTQSRQVTGLVMDSTGAVLPAANIRLKGNERGTISSADGSFKLQVPTGTVMLEISAVGYRSKTVELEAGKNSLTVELLSGVHQLETVVVTALGISRKARTITYATQSVSNEELTTVKSTNLLNSLNGKVAGVQINRTSGGPGGSVRIVIRGDKSTRSSQPLYVIDGIPVNNPTGGPGASLYNYSPDGGDILSSINPEDVESVNILKGASASALYGSQGSNGVVLISTKKGKAGTSKIDVSSSVTFDRPFVFPQLQYSYAQSTPASQTSPGSEDSWGARGVSQPNKDFVKDFFQTGVTFINSLTFSSGNERSTNYVSYSNTDNKGIVPTSTFKQHTFSFRQSAKFLNDKLVFDGSFLGSIQKVHNRLTPGVYFNPLTGLYLFPRGQNFEQYKTYEYFSQSRYLNAQDWWNINYDKDQLNGGGWGGQDYQQNPYWILNRNPIDHRNQNILVSASLKYLLSSWLTVQLRGNLNDYVNEQERRIYATSQGTLSKFNGLMHNGRNHNTTVYGDLILMGDRKLHDNLTLNFTLGTSIQDQSGKSIGSSGTPNVPNVFLEAAMDRSQLVFGNGASKKQTQSVFGSAQLGYKNMLFLDLADRNDWSSTMAFTPTEKKGYNYYSIGASAVLNEMLRLPAAINFAKIRASYAEVGNDISAYSTYPLYGFSGGIAYPPGSNPVTNVPGLELKPEKNKAFEIGTQWTLLQNRLSVDLTWYQSNTIHQYFSGVTLLIGTSLASDINAGKIQNKGLEATISYKVKDTKSFSWTTTLNYSHNRNKIVELFDPNVVKGASAESRYGVGGGFTQLKQGGSFGDIYERTFKTNPQGQIIVNKDTHLPVLVDSFICNTNPKFILGWQNTFTIKNLSLNVIIDGKFGGGAMSVTDGYLDQMGVSKRSADARDDGGVVKIKNAVTSDGHDWNGTVDAQTYYKHVGGKTPAGAAYTFDATAIRLRELSLLYKIPVKSKMVKEVKVGLIGSNLFFFKREAPFDPEQVSGVNPGGIGIDVFGLPAYRSMGFNIKFSF